MLILTEFAPLLAAMVVLTAGSAFFSCSEAALFSLQAEDRRKLQLGNAADRQADALLVEPDRLLTTILFWNLMINVTYFALASVVALQMQRDNRSAEAGGFAVASLLVIILLSEMVPKTVGVLIPRVMASLVSLPLTLAVRTLQPIAPWLLAVDSALRRVFFPGFVTEPYLELSDLERAITISTTDQELAAQERMALQNIVSLSDLQAEELMRPRRLIQSFRPPVHLDDLGGQVTRSGYLLVTELDSDEITAAIALKNLSTVPRQHLEQFAQAVVYVPWCASAAAVFDQLQTHGCEVAAVLNELGETVGIVTLEDLLDTIFQDEASRSARLLERAPIVPVANGVWHVTGMTSLRRLSNQFGVSLPDSKNTTLAGIVQEVLQRLPTEGDSVHWGGFRLLVLQVSQQGPMIVELTIDAAEPEQT